MKKISRNKLGLTIAITSYLLLLFSCEDKAISPTDETLDKEHGNWYKVEFIFTEGHIHGDDQDHEKLENEEVFFHGLPEFGTYLKTIQKYSFSNPNKPGEGIIADTKEAIRLIEGVAYGLEINYYSKTGELMNHEFTTDKMAAMHQHFFIPKNINSIIDGIETGTKTNLIHYKYRDTKPWNGMFGSANVSLRGENDPIGLKGYFYTKKAYQAFNLNVILVHVIRGSKLNDEGKPYPFYAPSMRVLGTQDLNLKVPIRIFTVYPKNDVQMETYISDIAKEFKITNDEAKKEVESRNLIDIEASNYKL